MKETQKRPMIFEIKPHTRIILMSGLLIMLFVTISMMAVMTLQKVAHSHHIIKQKVMDGQSSSEELSKLFQETEALQINLPLSTVIYCYLMGSEGADLVKTTLVWS